MPKSKPSSAPEGKEKATQKPQTSEEREAGQRASEKMLGVEKREDFRKERNKLGFIKKKTPEQLQRYHYLNARQEGVSLRLERICNPVRNVLEVHNGKRLGSIYHPTLKLWMTGKIEPAVFFSRSFNSLRDRAMNYSVNSFLHSCLLIVFYC